MHKFWSGQPVSQRRKDQRRPGFIHNSYPLVPHPIRLPESYHWSVLTGAETEELTTFLNEHYVEDVGHRFRFRYAPVTVRALCFTGGEDRAGSAGSGRRPSPGPSPVCLGVRYPSPTGRLCAVIVGVPHRVYLGGESYPAYFVDFLTVHKQLRGRRMTPVLIRELARRIANDGHLLAYYNLMTAPTAPVVDMKFYHYPMRLERLVQAGYWTRPTPGVSLAALARLYDQLPPPTTDWRRLTTPDPVLARRLSTWAKHERHQWSRLITTNDLARWLAADYRLYQSPLGDLGYYLLDNVSLADATVVLREVFVLYVVPAESPDGPSGAELVSTLLQELLILAKVDRADVVIATAQSVVTAELLTALRFKGGDETTHWFLWNYHHPPTDPGEVFLPVP